MLIIRVQDTLLGTGVLLATFDYEQSANQLVTDPMLQLSAFVWTTFKTGKLILTSDEHMEIHP